MELSAFTRSPGESPESFAVRVYDYVFRTKIERLLAKEEMWADENGRNRRRCRRLRSWCPRDPLKRLTGLTDLTATTTTAITR